MPPGARWQDYLPKGQHALETRPPAPRSQELTAGECACVDGLRARRESNPPIGLSELSGVFEGRLGLGYLTRGSVAGRKHGDPKITGYEKFAPHAKMLYVGNLAQHGIERLIIIGEAIPDSDDKAVFSDAEAATASRWAVMTKADVRKVFGAVDGWCAV